MDGVHPPGGGDGEFISGQLSDNVFDTPGRLIDTTGSGTSMLFVASGAARGGFVGLRHDFAGEVR